MFGRVVRGSRKLPLFHWQSFGLTKNSLEQLALDKFIAGNRPEVEPEFVNHKDATLHEPVNPQKVSFVSFVVKALPSPASRFPRIDTLGYTCAEFQAKQGAQ